MREYTISAPANGAPAQINPGEFSFFFCRAITTAAQVSFNGEQWFNLNQNDQFGPLPKASSTVFARTTSGLESDIDFQVDKKPFATQITQVSSARSYLRGNLNIPNGAAAANGYPACSGAGLLQITAGMLLPLTGINGKGFRRQQIIFSAVTDFPLQVFDPNGNQVINITTNGAPFVLATDADFVISGNGGTSQVNIGEIFLQTKS